MKERLKYIRKTLKLTQLEISERLQLNRSYYSQLENGSRPIIDKVINRLASEFSVNSDWFRSGVGEPFLNDGRQEKFDIDAFIKENGFSEEVRLFLKRYIKLSEDEKRNVDKLMSAIFALYPRSENNT